jgi:hypothetical protein
MLPHFARFQRWALVFGLVPILALAATACSKSEEVSQLAEASLRPNAQAPIVVPAGEPIVVGISVPLTGPDEAEGTEDRDAAVVGVDRWKE